VIEGDFSLGWIGKLTPEQLEFVGLLLQNRGNVQKLASELGVAYNTARSRLDEIVAALGGRPEREGQEGREQPDRRDILRRLQEGEISFDEAMAQLRG
jgi:hypothetical protein